MNTYTLHSPHPEQNNIPLRLLLMAVVGLVLNVVCVFVYAVLRLGANYGIEVSNILSSAWPGVFVAVPITLALLSRREAARFNLSVLVFMSVLANIGSAISILFVRYIVERAGF